MGTVLALLIAASAACGTSGGSSPTSSPASGSTPTSGSAPPTAPAAAAPGEPSFSAKQVCDPNDGQKDIAETLGVTPTRVEGPTWVDHLYTCRFVYPDGSFVLSVKELPDAARTDDYVNQLTTSLGRQDKLRNLGEDAFYTNNDSVVTRKDQKVLLVDTSRLPDQFSNPPTPRAAVSRIIATVIMGCWTGN